MIFQEKAALLGKMANLITIRHLTGQMESLGKMDTVLAIIKKQVTKEVLESPGVVVGMGEMEKEGKMGSVQEVCIYIQKASEMAHLVN